MWNLKNKINEQMKQEKTHRCREQTDDCQSGGKLGDWMKKVKGLGSTSWGFQNSHRDLKYSLGNVVTNIVITMHGARWVLEIKEETLCEDMIG